MNDISRLETARACWGDAMPDYVEVLAQECDRSTQSAVAKRLNRSATLVSNVLRNKYTGDMAAVADVVRGVFMGRSVTCPALGSISTAACGGRTFRTGRDRDLIEASREARGGCNPL